LEAYARQDAPFEILVESLRVERNLDRAPLFQAGFAMQNAPTAELELAGIKLSRVGVDAGRAQFDITLSVSETEDGGINGSINYKTELFHAATIERLQEHFRTLLEDVTSRPDAKISELSLLTAAEREDLLFARNRTATPYPRPLCIHQLFEEQARRSPE